MSQVPRAEVVVVQCTYDTKAAEYSKHPLTLDVKNSCYSPSRFEDRSSIAKPSNPPTLPRPSFRQFDRHPSASVVADAAAAALPRLAYAAVL